MLARKIGKCNADQKIEDKKKIKNHIKDNMGCVESKIRFSFLNTFKMDLLWDFDETL